MNLPTKITLTVMIASAPIIALIVIWNTDIMKLKGEIMALIAIGFWLLCFLCAKGIRLTWKQKTVV